jgi:hypothetical protein
MEEAKIFAKFVRDYSKGITKNNLIFYSDKRPTLTIPNLTKGYKKWLKETGNTVDNPEWTMVRALPAKPIETMEDIAAVFKNINGNK